MQKKSRFKNIGVLMGGLSAEREISLKSGQAVSEALTHRGYNVKRLIIEDLNEIKSLIKKSSVDCIFIALHGGFGEDGTIQKILDEMKLPYTGSGPEASHRAMDKVETKKIFEEEDLPSPPYKILKANQEIEDYYGLNLPVVVKPSNQGSSIGLEIVYKKEDFKRAVSEALKFNSHVIIEQYIKGKEITVGILNNRALPVIEIKPRRKFYDYQAKYTEGLTEYLVPANLDKALTHRIQQVALRAHEVLKCDYFSRIDIRLSKDKQVYILEVNTIPGLTSQSLLPKAAQTINVNFEDLCQMITEAASFIPLERCSATNY